MEVKQRSDGEAIQVFRDNLHNLLLAPPAGPISVLGIDPGMRTGCKVAVIDETGKFLAHDVIYLHRSKGEAEAAAQNARNVVAAAQRARHRHRQRHGFARDGCLRARISCASGGWRTFSP